MDPVQLRVEQFVKDLGKPFPRDVYEMIIEVFCALHTFWTAASGLEAECDFRSSDAGIFVSPGCSRGRILTCLPSIKIRDGTGVAVEVVKARGTIVPVDRCDRLPF